MEDSRRNYRQNYGAMPIICLYEIWPSVCGYALLMDFFGKTRPFDSYDNLQSIIESNFDCFAQGWATKRAAKPFPDYLVCNALHLGHMCSI